ncbi:tRNA (adenosine(37)-N6)-threonylcarbamoyltransferase complex ATPase subunit type 1 TsaE [Dongia deserti]|uniref:tRNA (adenosine(37)-N6)-threonylcarbamoyltransferase complex ATPase subunit type 1 TsaE n=1 Tax=Dongia deserti TaxID=2268030 RepID=UPI000E65CEFD|nr:tRNA (adenosine(37)-N6)-threonylcarbamoyltransferase complex ATPase subunit type 1 TsaE [Dongia deserti]
MIKSDSAPVIDLPDLAATNAFGRRVAKVLQRGDVVALKGGLGVGKTTLARAIVAGLSPESEDVPSPTFTLVQTYPVTLGSGPADLWHFDLYRLDRPDQVYELGIEEALADAVSLIEWPELAAGLLPKENLLTIELQITHGEARRALIEGGASWRSRLAELL